MFAEAVADERTDEKVAIGGTANLVRFGEDFDRLDQAVLEALEEHVVLLKLLGEATSPSLVTVRIGHEVPHEQLADDFRRRHRLRSRRPSRSRRSASSGPTRMDYPASMAAVNAVARYVSQILSDAMTASRDHIRTGLTEHDPRSLRDPRRLARCEPRGDQEGLPPAGAPAAPRRQPGRGRPRSASRRSPARTTC